MEAKRGPWRVVVEKPEGKRPLGRPKHRWEEHIKTDLREEEWGGAWIRSILLRMGTCDGLL
jgi:hypothetical protein